MNKKRTPRWFFRNLPIRFKLLVVYITVFTLAITAENLAIFSLIRRTIEANIESELSNTTSALVNMVGTTANASIKNYLRAVAEKNREIVAHIYGQYQDGILTEEAARALAMDILLSQTIGDTGYMYCLNSQGVLEVHPREPLRGADISEYEFVQEQIRRKEGYLEYEWANPGEPEERPKALYMTYFEPWDWIISASSYREEFTTLVDVDYFRNNILSIQFGETGYPYMMNSQGTLIVHPQLEGSNILDSKDADGRMFIKEICERKTGEIIYPWQNPGEPAPREKLAIFDYIPEFDWIVASSSYLEEFYAPLRTMAHAVTLIVLVALLVVLPLTIWISATITRPLQQLMGRFAQGAGGDLTVRMQVNSTDEVGQLASYFNNFMGKLETEISERTQAEAALRRSERKMADIINFLPDATLVIDEKGKVIAWNQAIQNMTGVGASEMMGRGDYEYALPFYGERRPILIDLVTKPQQDVEAEYAALKRQGTTIAGETYVQNLTGNQVYLFAIASALYDGQGNIVGAIESIRDITERKQAEEELQRYREQLEDLVEARTVELKHMTREALQARETAEAARQTAERANRAKSVFLANMSHELRTPLNAILGYSQLMARDAHVTPAQQEYLDTIARSGEHLLGLINDVLTMSKIEAGRTTLQENGFDLHRQLRGLQEMFQVRAENKGLALLLDIAPDVPRYVYADEGKLRQVLMNLLSNAVKFTEEGGVTLRVGIMDQRLGIGNQEPETDRQTPISILFDIEDTGVGIAPEEMGALFDPFVQTASGQQSQEGTGLGLPISQQFVTLMGGELDVSSIVDRGTIFRVRIPVFLAGADVVEALDLQPQRRVTGIEPDQTAPDGGPFRLLVVEDKPTNRELLIKLLMPFGFEVRYAVNGAEGVEMWEAWQPHLVWMDMRMPVMDGYEAARQIKARAEAVGRQVVIVALTASAFEEERETILAVGCDDFVRKPFHEHEIFDVLHRYLGVRFIYDPVTSVSDAAGSVSLEDLRADVETLPAAWATDLCQAIVALDDGQMLALIESVRPQAPRLADTLARWVRDFEYERLMALVAPEE